MARQSGHPTQDESAISEISLAVLKGEVNPPRKRFTGQKRRRRPAKCSGYKPGLKWFTVLSGAGTEASQPTTLSESAENASPLKQEYHPPYIPPSPQRSNTRLYATEGNSRQLMRRNCEGVAEGRARASAAPPLTDTPPAVYLLHTVPKNTFS